MAFFLFPRKGHNSIIHEMKDSLEAKPGAIILSVGGGGLLCGVVSGLQEVGWLDVPIIAMETRGADSYNAAIKAGRLVTLPDITRYVVWVRVGCSPGVVPLPDGPHP